MVHVGSWEKFKLLLWKNWTLQWSHKTQLVVELVLPGLFSLLLVLVRTLVDAEAQGITTYPALDIDNLDLFRQEKNPNSDVTFQLLYSPDNDLLGYIVGNASMQLNLVAPPVAYPNATAMENDLRGGRYLAGVQFNDDWTNITEYPLDFTYALRFPSELRTSTADITMTWLTTRLFPGFDIGGPRNNFSADGGIPVGYLREGFLPVQAAISRAYLKLASAVAGNTEPLPELKMQRYPYPEYIFDPLLEGLASIMFLIILLSFIYPCTYITKYITTEKEKQLKEVMKIMGLANWIHWAAWFVKSFIMLAISTFLIVLFLKIRWVDDVAVLTFSSFSALYVYFLVYITASICFCFMMAVFFSRASTAAAVTGLVWFIASIPFSFNVNTYDDMTLGSKLGWCLISNSAVGFGIKLILDWEGTGAGLQWSNLFEPVTVDDTLTVGYTMLMMLAGAVLYMIVCLYVEQIFPGDFGVPKKWYFPFTRHFWCGNNDYIGVEDINGIAAGDASKARQNPDAFEAEPSGKHVGLQVKNLKKRFGDKMAVKGLSVNMYEDEITVLLGHNGAGKTTTISMLTGMFPPTSGTAIINGSDIRSNIEGARMSLGICPQHNVLFDDMSVANHIVFFSRLKGLRGAAVQKEVDKYLRMIELEDKANVASSKLSGGMKRKLSVCCALCGGTKVVLCDEPSSGMDPSARRQLWDLLQAEKVGRTLLLTTHFMDEADVLGDRIAIMCDGELKCHGTSFFLKKKYGSGYHLICVKREDCVAKDVSELLQRYIPGIQPESDIGAELSYQLPDNYSNVFEEMFAALEQSSDDLNLSGYGVGITSMEEVFMKVGSENAKDGTRKTQSAIMNGTNGNGDDDAQSIQSDGAFAANSRLLKGTDLALNQWQAMFVKKMLYTFRNKLLLLVQNLIPVFFVVITIVITRNQSTFRDLIPMTIGLNQYPIAVTVLERNPNTATNSMASSVADKYEMIAQSYGPQFTLETTGSQSFSEYILDLGRTLQVRINSRYLAAATVSNDGMIAWLNNQPFHTAPLTVNMVHNAMAKALLNDSAAITVINAPLPYSTETIFNQLNTGNNLGTQLSTNLCFCMCFVSAFYILFLIKERESRSKLLQFVGGVNVWTFWLTQFLWDFVTYLVTAIIVIATLACFQEEGFSTFSELGRYFVVLLLFGCAVLPFTYLMSFLFSEPATGFARISIVNIFTGMALFIVIIVMSFQFFDTKDTADALSWFFRLFPHFSLAMGINKLYINVAIRNACENSPFINYPDIVRCKLTPQCCDIPTYFAWQEPGILPETVYLIGSAVLYFGLLIIREYGLINEIIYKLRNLRFKAVATSEDGFIDDDVAREKERIVAMNSYELLQQNLVLDQVTKYYNRFLAVNRISLCVNHNECFGLLGVNGAGKTTTFKMMTGDERISSGSAYIRGMNLKTDMNNIYKEIGYCPQFDALLEDLTGRETLLMFCLLRGIHRNQIRHVSEELAKSFGFMKHMDKPTKAYSGGNKRKLSTAIAVIGGPSVIYLDEPTTGMDPAARRQLWNMVCRLRDSGKSIVLTSHSMEECEALCTRLAIMVNGEFKCMGSTQHLKNKFSKGLILKIKVKRNSELEKRAAQIDTHSDEQSVPAQLMQQNIATVKEFVQREFPEAILQEEYQGILTFYIPLSGIKWSVMFGLMERNRDDLNVEDYSISQTTLEEIFLEFAKYQREDTRAPKRKFYCCGTFG